MSDDYRGNPIASFAVGEDNFTSGENKSRFEVVQDDLLLEFASISTINGYRNDLQNCIGEIRHPDIITQFPEIGVEVSKIQMAPLDDACTVFTAYVNVQVQAAIEHDTDTSEHPANRQLAVGRMYHDLVRVMASIYKKNIVTNDHKWNIVKEGYEVNLFSGFTKQNRSALILNFRVHIRNLEALAV